MLLIAVRWGPRLNDRAKALPAQGGIRRATLRLLAARLRREEVLRNWLSSIDISFFFSLSEETYKRTATGRLPLSSSQGAGAAGVGEGGGPACAGVKVQKDRWEGTGRMKTR